ncbi:hypothetical protein BE221DRAFT_188339 [Ostreococcus tauri]|uniref:Secreted protein n=1 Tax=Ostreococcus tauri TaxID=70448 RepID=A0A1Y5IPR4_OSTTA|nr:hypothetical protein BE221DRAFT_188339 [Ostreococcus tauri]
MILRRRRGLFRLCWIFVFVDTAAQLELGDFLLQLLHLYFNLLAEIVVRLLDLANLFVDGSDEFSGLLSLKLHVLRKFLHRICVFIELDREILKLCRRVINLTFFLSESTIEVNEIIRMPSDLVLDLRDVLNCFAVCLHRFAVCLHRFAVPRDSFQSFINAPAVLRRELFQLLSFVVDARRSSIQLVSCFIDSLTELLRFTVELHLSVFESIVQFIVAQLQLLELHTMIRHRLLQLACFILKL